MIRKAILPAVAFLMMVEAGGAQTMPGPDEWPSDRFRPRDVFELEWASDPQISPDGTQIVFVRNSFDIMTDRTRSSLWIVNFDGTDARPLASRENSFGSPRWSPDGGRLLYVSSEEGSAQIFLRWMDTGQTAKLTNLTETPTGLSWSPDGAAIAFSMFVPESTTPFARMPEKPEGAMWADPARVITKLQYRADGVGYLPDGHTQIFVLPAEGGTPRQVTEGPFNHGGTPSWSPDGRSLYFSSNRRAGWEYEPSNTELYRVSLDDGSMEALTDRLGPDSGPVVSPDGRRVAYLGYDERYQGYQVTGLYVMGVDGSDRRVLASDLDRDPQGPTWSQDGSGLFVHYSDQGNGKLAFVPLEGELEVLAGDLGGLSIGRPYSGGSFSVSRTGRFAFTHTLPDHPADVAVGARGATGTTRITRLNDDLFGHKELGEVEEIWFESSFDGRSIQGWILKPPGFDPSQKYPLILEIHGGPFADYGDRFSAEDQLYASAGFVVLYINPRGSTSYGEEFGNLIHHAYPGQDYDDLMSGVDEVLSRGYVDEGSLFVTGGSGGGVLTSWIVGKTGRFAAAVVAKPVINWYSFVLHADGIPFFYRYWFPGYPWENLEHYMERSPISLVGNVSTPTMLLTGEDDYRTPMSETEQYYAALKLRRVPTAMVRIPDASHGIAARPSNLVAKVLHILRWFETYRLE
jgi:acylaminoacyl-peptidase